MSIDNRSLLPLNICMKILLNEKLGLENTGRVMVEAECLCTNLGLNDIRG